MSGTRHHGARFFGREYVSARLRGYPPSNRFSKRRTHRVERLTSKAVVAAEVEEHGAEHLCDGSCEWCCPTPSPDEADYLRAFPRAPTRTA